MNRTLLVLLAAVMAASLVCKQVIDDPDNWSELTEETVTGSLDALAAADSVYQRVAAAQSAEAAAESTKTFLLAHESVAAAGVPAPTSVTAFFANGIVGSVYGFDRGTRDSAWSPPTESSMRAAGGGEAIASAVVLTPFAHQWGKVAEDWVADRLDTCFGGMSGATERFTNTEVSVDLVKNVLTAGPGVLLWSSHGALVFKDTVNWDDWSVLLTGESYPSQGMAAQIIRNYSSGATALGADRELVVVTIKGRHYLAVTPKFVSRYGNFDYMEGMGHNAAKSVVYACCCYSGVTGAGMPGAFMAAGADVYVGWSESVMALFAAQRQILFFNGAADTCTTIQAYYGIGNVTDPKTAAQLLHYATDSVMIRAQMRFRRDGTALRGHSVGVAMASGVTTVNCFASQPMQEPQYGLTVHFPGTGPGSWNCTSDEDAVIALTELASGKLFIVQKDYVGVNGSIDVGRYDEDVISGKFNGTLGRWGVGQNPEEDPPNETVEIQNGIIKHVGLRQ